MTSSRCAAERKKEKEKETIITIAGLKPEAARRRSLGQQGIQKIPSGTGYRKTSVERKPKREREE